MTRRLASWFAILGAAAALRPPRARRARRGLRAASASAATTAAQIAVFEDVDIPAPAPGPPTQEITVVDLMPDLRRLVKASGLANGSARRPSGETRPFGLSASFIVADPWWSPATWISRGDVSQRRRGCDVDIPWSRKRHQHADAAKIIINGSPQVNVISRHTTTAVTINEWESRLVRDVRAWLLKLAPPDDRSAIGRDDGTGSSSAARIRTNRGDAVDGTWRVRGTCRYLHNDIHLRPDSDDERERCLENGWDVDDPASLAAWRAQEPINAHSHLGAMLLGSSESIPVARARRPSRPRRGRRSLGAAAAPRRRRDSSSRANVVERNAAASQVDGAMVLGQWQSVMLVDLDGPRPRKVGVQLLGFG